MKIITLILLFSSLLFPSQKYFYLENLKSFPIKEYALETKDIYDINKNIIIYNVFISKNNILLLSVLPPLEKDNLLTDLKQIKENNWEKIDFDKAKNQVFTQKELINLVSNWSENNIPKLKTLEYKLIKKENGSYYVSKYCLTELFSIKSLEFPFVTNYGVINIKDKKVTIKQMRSSFEKQFPKEEFIMDVRNNNLLFDLNVTYNYRNYLSKKIKINNQKAYKFWTFDGWWTQDGYNEHRGIDRFLYIPNKGIVGGSYDFYFKLKPKNSSNNYYTASTSLLWNNIINEKIMISKDIF